MITKMKTTPLYKNPTTPVEHRVTDLLRRMTLDEKIAQLYQIWVLDHNREESLDFIRQNGVGSRILAGSALAGSAGNRALEIEDINLFQRTAVEESRLGIPILFGRDVIHGYRTMFPIPLGMAASWDVSLVEEAYTIAAREATSAGVNWAFGPMLDIARDPRWGRIAEGSGEDPFLTSAMARAAVHGFQGDDLSAPDRIMACAKHYIGYGAAEGGRDYNTSEISDTTLRNIYLPPFKAAVEAGVGSVMSGFHDLNGESVSGSHYLLTELLKDELHFDGFIISDWGSVAELVNHRVAEDDADAARLGFTSGVDMEMVTTCYIKSMKLLVENGKVSKESIDEACRRILKAKFQAGLFEHPYAQPDLAEKTLFAPAHQTLARKLAGETLVLVKNDQDLLPLARSGRKIAVMGPLINQRAALLGSWAVDGLAEDAQTINAAMRLAAPEAVMPNISDAMVDEMLRAGMRADVIVYFAGESDQRGGENQNIASIDLPPGQEETIQALAGLGKPMVLVVLAERALNLHRVAHFAQAIIYAWHPGSLGAAAIADVLFGDVCPSGKLPVTLPRATGQIPLHYNFKSTGKNFDVSGRPAGKEYAYVDRYVDIPTAPLYPFGFGLSYTQFTFADIQIDRTELHPGESVHISAQVTNTGARAGTEVVQCYLQDCVASITRPVRELKGFSRVSLQPGETRRISFPVSEEQLAFYGLDGKLKVEAGLFKAWIGGDSTATLETSFRWVNQLQP
jgi:beta-glucosidase